jgi:hypothetical protein
MNNKNKFRKLITDWTNFISVENITRLCPLESIMARRKKVLMAIII